MPRARNEMMPPPPAPSHYALGGKEFTPNASMDPGLLTRENSPVEIREWVRRFQDYLRDGLRSGDQPSCQLIKRQVLNKMDDFYHSRLEAQVVSAEGKDWKYFEELIWAEVEVIHPLMRRRDDFVHMTQAPNEAFSDHYRRVERQAAECSLANLKPEELIAHIAINGMSNKALKKEILLRKALEKSKIIEVVTAYESYHQLEKRGASARRVGSSRDSSRQMSSREGSRERRKCFNCGSENHYARDCKQGKRWCDSCKSTTHNSEDCWSKKKRETSSANRAETRGRLKSRTSRRSPTPKKKETQKEEGVELCK